MPKKSESRINYGPVFSFRLTNEVGQATKTKIKDSGLTASEFFRQAVILNKSEIVQKRIQTQDQKRGLFLLAKLSNNVNQIAHRVNSELKINRQLSVSTVESVLAALHELVQLAKGYSK